MSQKIAKLFIATGLFFLVLGCIEGLMFPTKMQFKSFYSTLFHIPPEFVKEFFGTFVAKIHTHVNLIGWVGSVLMGLLYFTAPKISGRERYSSWVAYLNWGCHTFGLLMMVTGFHMIGFIGLSAGFVEGSPEFAQLVGPVKNLVSAGGTLIALSVFLFAYNMIRTLFAPQSKQQARTHLTNAGASLAKATTAGILLLGLTLPLSPAEASPAVMSEKLPVIMVGDRLVDTAHSLGVVPAAMSVRCSLWPLCDTLKSSVQVIGCPGCLLKKKGAPLFKYAEKHGIRQVLIEKSTQFCEYLPELDLEKIGDLARAKGYAVSYVDFTQGLEHALNQTAKLLGQQDKAGEALALYQQAMAKTKTFIKGKSFVKRVVIIRGTYQAGSGKTFLRIETPGGYADRFLLAPLGIKNLGHLAVPKGKKPSKGHIQVRKLKGLIAAAPDAIIMTGNAPAVQKAIYQAIKATPALADVPALKAHALFSLPGYVDASVMEYPGILKQWADFLVR